MRGCRSQTGAAGRRALVMIAAMTAVALDAASVPPTEFWIPDNGDTRYWPVGGS